MTPRKGGVNAIHANINIAIRVANRLIDITSFILTITSLVRCRDVASHQSNHMPERLVERLGRNNLRIFPRHGDGQNTNVVILRKNQRGGVRWQLH